MNRREGISADRLPRKVIHVMNSASGGAALSTMGVMNQLREYGVGAAAICDDSSMGTKAERDALSDATQGEVIFTPLYWWNRKVRAKTWKRPLLEAYQLFRTGLRVRTLGTIAHAVRTWDADLIHTNTLLTPEGGRAARLLGLGHVWHLREMLGPGQPFRLPLEGEALGAYLVSHASVVVANSEASAGALKPLLPPGRLEVIPNGLNLEPFEKIERPPRSGRLVMAMVANVTSRWKKQALFVEAARRAPGAEYRLYGHCPEPGKDAYADDLRRQCAAAGVKVMGFVAAEKVMADIDVLVHTADQESFGRTVVEAMAAGLPVVGVAGGGVGETVVDGLTGLLSAPDAPEPLALNLLRMISEPHLRAKLGAAGRVRAREQYSIAACGLRMAKVYQRAVVTPVASRLAVLSTLGAFR